jgi:hypothetical protein
MQEKRRIKEIQTQLKMKELELEQLMLSKEEKEERVYFVLPSSTK